MAGDEDFSLIVRTVLHRDRIGHRLLCAYFWVAAVVVLVSCAAQPSVGWIFIAASFGIGVVLLIDVSAANRRARKPLRAGWPKLAELPPREKPPGARRRVGETRVQPHSGPGGFFFVAVLGLVAAAGGIAVQATRGGPAAAALIAMLATLLVVLVPLLTFTYVMYRRQSRLPYLARLEEELASAERHGPPRQSRAVQAPRTHTRMRPWEYVWLAIIGLVLLARVGTLVAVLVEAALPGH